MADNIPTPGGAVPPKPAEAKVQPKKETVRITLPPKPTAAPTIKLPTLPPTAGGPAGAPPPTTAAPPPSPAAAPTVQAASPLSGQVPSARPTQLTTSRPGAPATGHAPAPGKPAAGAPPAPAPTAQKPAPSRAKVGVVDTILAIAALVVNLAAVGTMYYLTTLFEAIQAAAQ